MTGWSQSPDSQDKPESQDAVGQILGYLNYSSGAPDPVFIGSMDKYFYGIDQRDSNPVESDQDDSVAVCQPRWEVALTGLQHELRAASQANPTFRDTRQADEVLTFTIKDFIPQYVQYHSILLGHHQPDQLFTQFFVARILESALTVFSENDGMLDFNRVRSRLDDYIGYRPVAALETQKIEPYEHEWTRPIPIYIAEVGSAHGRYKPFVDYALEMLRSAPKEILLAAQLDLDALDEVAIDPRAYDFEHPVNKRPNYHFGQWDPHHLDLSGNYRRLVVQQVTLDALAKRCDVDELLKPEMIYEAGAVLAGTILMAVSICGRSPDAFDSNTSIAGLLPGIARMRDHFYKWLLSTIKGKHGERLRDEAKEKRQPFGGARQSLNSELARVREAQLETVRLSGVFARMGYPENALDQAKSVPVASARLRTEIECLLADAELLIRKRKLSAAADRLAESYQLSLEGIQCGALIDPWNIIGFDGQFSLFPAMENSVQDERAHFLVDIITQMFATYSNLWSHAAVGNEQELCTRIQEQFERVTDWWHQFAAHEVTNVEAPNGKEIYRAAEQVANAMNLWRQQGTETGNVAFWAQHANLFETPRAYELIVNALLEKEDLSTSMALIMHWLSQAETVGLESTDSSFHFVVEQWAYRVSQKAMDEFRSGDLSSCNKTLTLIRKFMDFLEVNAESYWDVPDFSLGENGSQRSADDGETVIEDGPDALYEAAYENVVFRDSTDDGIEGAIYENEDGHTDYMDEEARRIENRLRFHESVARIWQMFAPVFAECSARSGENPAKCDQGHDTEKELAKDGGGAGNQDSRHSSAENENVSSWSQTAYRKLGRLHHLLFSVESMKPSANLEDQESMMEYDRQRFIQEGLLDRIIMVTVETRLAMRMLNGATTVINGKVVNEEELDGGEILMADVLAAVMRNDRDQLRDQIVLLNEHLKTQPLLYVPISRNGAPSKIELVKSRQLFIRKLLEILPRFGLIEQTFRLLNVARSMERSHPVGNGAVTEFDDLFEIGFRGVVNCLIHSAENDDSTADQRQLLFRWLERFTESSLIIWLKHSRTLRLSVLEKVHDKDPWRQLINFIKDYGADIFTQRFLNFANIRGILHRGIENWLDLAAESGQFDWKLFRDYGSKISRDQAVSHMSLILEAILENHLEYQDYNSTTTQSDQGDLLYMLIDFLRLKIEYERISWHLRPVFWAHDNLVNSGKDQVAKRWRRSLIDRIQKKANRFVRYLERLQRRYAMQMPSVANRIQEKFIKPMHIDRMKALIRPALDHDNPKANSIMEILQHDTGQLIQNPEGSGIKIPSWLAAIEDELAEALDTTVSDCKLLDLFVRTHCLSRDEAREHLNKIAEFTNRKKKD